MTNLPEAISAIYPLPSEVLAAFVDLFKVQDLFRNHLLIEPRRVNQNLYFVQKGLVREFYVDDAEEETDNDREVTAAFVSEGSFCFSTISFITGSPARRSLQTLEATQVYCLSHAQLSEFAVAHPEILWWIKVLYENKMVHFETRLRIIRTRSTKEGLDLFLKRFKGIYQRIPAKHVASYLNITASTLSRLQNKTE